MSFDWQQASKERYFRIVEENIETAGFSDFLHIDRTAFGTVAGKTVKVYMEKIHRIGNVRRWQQARKSVSGTQGMHTASQFLRQERKADFSAWIFRDRDGGRGMIQRFLWMFKVKDCGIRCRKICLFCKYYRMCREEGI